MRLPIYAPTIKESEWRMHSKRGSSRRPRRGKQEQNSNTNYTAAGRGEMQKARVFYLAWSRKEILEAIALARFKAAARRARRGASAESRLASLGRDFPCRLRAGGARAFVNLDAVITRDVARSRLALQQTKLETTKHRTRTRRLTQCCILPGCLSASDGVVMAAVRQCTYSR